MKEETKESIKENIVAIVIILAVVSIITFWVHRAQNPPEDPEQRFPMPLYDASGLGNADAPVVVVEFSDFECGFCSSFAEDFPEIKERYIDTGRVFFLFRHFPLTQIHSHSLQAAHAAVCAEIQGKFWEYHDILYENQNELEIGHLQGYAESIGLNLEEFGNCILSEEALNQVRQDREIGAEAGVKGTPTFFFNGRRVTGMLTPDEFGEEIENENGN